jgi:hypothetical protein
VTTFFIDNATNDIGVHLWVDQNGHTTLRFSAARLEALTMHTRQLHKKLVG